MEDIDLDALTPGEDLNWLEDVTLLQEDGVAAVFDRYSNSFLKIYFDIPAGREDEFARKVLMKHLIEGNSYGIQLKTKHAKFPQPMLGPWVEDSETVGTDWKPAVMEGWERPAGHCTASRPCQALTPVTDEPSAGRDLGGLRRLRRLLRIRVRAPAARSGRPSRPPPVLRTGGGSGRPDRAGRRPRPRRWAGHRGVALRPRGASSEAPARAALPRRDRPLLRTARGGGGGARPRRVPGMSGPERRARGHALRGPRRVPRGRCRSSRCEVGRMASAGRRHAGGRPSVPRTRPIPSS